MYICRINCQSVAHASHFPLCSVVLIRLCQTHKNQHHTNKHKCSNGEHVFLSLSPFYRRALFASMTCCTKYSRGKYSMRVLYGEWKYYVCTVHYVDAHCMGIFLLLSNIDRGRRENTFALWIEFDLLLLFVGWFSCCSCSCDCCRCFSISFLQCTLCIAMKL